MTGLGKYNIVPIGNFVLREDLATYNSPKDKINQLNNAGELIHLKRGLYAIPRAITGQSLSKELIANHIYGPSYVSYESALSYHGLIPERVYVTKSATLKRKREYQTPVGVFQYITVPEAYYPIGLMQEIINENYAFIIACPEKALCDLVLGTSGLRFQSTKAVRDYLLDDLRISGEDIQTFDINIINNCSLHGYKKADIQRLANYIMQVKNEII